MSKQSYLLFHELCYGREVVILGPAQGPEMMDPQPMIIEQAVVISVNNVLSPFSSGANIWLDNDCGHFPYKYLPNDLNLAIRAAHGRHKQPLTDLLFLSGPMSEDQMTFAPPELLIDAAWHKEISFSPLAGVVALEKVRHTAATKIYMLGMDLYQGKQSLAYSHSLVDNARYISEIARNDSRVVLCEALENSIREILS